MGYCASYNLRGPRPVGVPLQATDSEWDTLFYRVRIFKMDREDPEEAPPVATLRVRRVLISKIVNEGRSVFESMDQIDQLQHDIYCEVWDEQSGGFRFEDSGCGDLLVFEDVEFAEAAMLPDFDINAILDDIAYDVGGGDGLCVFVESYGDLVRFNVEYCERLRGIGYALPASWSGLARRRQ